MPKKTEVIELKNGLVAVFEKALAVSFIMMPKLDANAKLSASLQTSSVTSNLVEAGCGALWLLNSFKWNTLYIAQLELVVGGDQLSTFHVDFADDRRPHPHGALTVV